LYRLSKIRNKAVKLNITCNQKKRTVYEPIPELKIIVSKIDQILLGSLRIPQTFCGVGWGRKDITHALRHTNKKCVLCLDIKDFFPSIHHTKVFEIFSRVLGCPANVAKLLTRLTTHDDQLPQGFPTSSCLSALTLLKVERRLSALCKQYGLNFSIYVDNLDFSGNWDFHPKLKDKIISIISQSGFKINPKKTECQHWYETQKVLKIKVNKKINIPDEKLQEVRALMNEFEKGTYANWPVKKQCKKLKHIQGKIGYIKYINPVIGNKLMERFHKIEARVPIKVNAA